MARESSGRVVFVAGALPGEVVDVQVVDERRDFAKARLLDVIDDSPDRTTPPCPFVAAGCGGCGWQHVTHEAQLRLKEQIVAEALGRIGGLHELPPIRTTHPDVGGRRTTVRAGIVDGRAGFHRAASTEVVPVATCVVSHPAISAVLAEGRFAHAEEIVVRTSVATAATVVLVRPGAAAGSASVPAGVAVGGRPQGLAVEEDVAGERLRVSAGAFFQASPEVAGALVEAVRVGAGALDGARVIDAYGGVGLFARAVAIAGGADSTTVVESDRVAAADARHNLLDRPGQVVRCEVARWRPSPADVVIADPARPGLGRPGVKALVAAAPDRFILVSCDAGSLGRDVRLLHSAGYRPEGVALVDAFPHTPHVEVVTTFQRVEGEPAEPSDG